MAQMKYRWWNDGAYRNIILFCSSHFFIMNELQFHYHCQKAGDDVREEQEEMKIHPSPVAPLRFPGPRSKKQQEETSNTPSRTILIQNPKFQCRFD